jgi:hypothetical protein
LDVKAVDSLIGELLRTEEPGLGQAAQSLVHSGVSMLGELKQFEGSKWLERGIVQVFVLCGAVGTQWCRATKETVRSPQSAQPRFNGIKYCILLARKLYYSPCAKNKGCSSHFRLSQCRLIDCYDVALLSLMIAIGTQAELLSKSSL